MHLCDECADMVAPLLKKLDTMEWRPRAIGTVPRSARVPRELAADIEDLAAVLDVTPSFLTAQAVAAGLPLIRAATKTLLWHEPGTPYPDAESPQTWTWEYNRYCPACGDYIVPGGWSLIWVRQRLIAFCWDCATSRAQVVREVRRRKIGPTQLI